MSGGKASAPHPRTLVDSNKVIQVVATLDKLKKVSKKIETVEYQGLKYRVEYGDFSTKVAADGVGYFVAIDGVPTTEAARVATAKNGIYLVEKCDTTGGEDCAAAFDRVSAIAPTGSTIATSGDSELKVASTAKIDLTNSIYINCDIKNIVPAAGFDDYLLHVELPTTTTERGVGNSLGYASGIIEVDCKNQSRGVKLTRVDDSALMVKALRPYGTGLKINLVRESELRVIFQGGRNRQTPAAGAAEWSAGADYAIGDFAKLPVSAWLVGTTYNRGDFARGSDGLPYMSKEDGNKGNDPAIGANPNYWVSVPDFYFVAIKESGPAGVGAKDVALFSSHNVVESDRYWMPILEDEALIECQQDYGFGDGSNNILFQKPIIHGCDHKTYFNIDSPDDQPIRNIDIVSPHIHYVSNSYISSGNAEAGQQVHDRVFLVRYGHFFRGGILAGHVRLAPNTADSCGIVIGKPYNTRRHQLEINTVASGEGDRQTGALILSGTGDPSNRLDFTDAMAGTDANLIVSGSASWLGVDKYGKETRYGVGAGCYSAVEDDTGVGAVGVRQLADTKNRIEMRSNGRIYFGDGSLALSALLMESASKDGRLACYNGNNNLAVTQVANSGDLLNSTSVINTQFKFAGKIGIESGKAYFALGELPSSKWRPFDDQSGISDVQPLPL